MSICSRTAVIATLLSGSFATQAQAEFIETGERATWEELAGQFTTITFTEFPKWTDVDDEYEDLGVTFGGDVNSIFSTPSFVNDNWGIDGNTETRLIFDVPITSFAVDFPGIIDVLYFRDGERIPGGGGFGGGGTGFFYGFVSSEPFDEVLLFDSFGGQIFVDDLHFGPPIPGPGAAAALLLAAGAFGCRRRRGFKSVAFSRRRGSWSRKT